MQLAAIQPSNVLWHALGCCLRRGLRRHGLCLGVGEFPRALDVALMSVEVCGEGETGAKKSKSLKRSRARPRARPWAWSRTGGVKVTDPSEVSSVSQVSQFSPCQRQQNARQKIPQTFPDTLSSAVSDSVSAVTASASDSESFLEHLMLRWWRLRCVVEDSGGEAGANKTLKRVSDTLSVSGAVPDPVSAFTASALEPESFLEH